MRVGLNQENRRTRRVQSKIEKKPLLNLSFPAKPIQKTLGNPGRTSGRYSRILFYYHTDRMGTTGPYVHDSRQEFPSRGIQKGCNVDDSNRLKYFIKLSPNSPF
ncbi:uncharacterized protein LOC135169623 [Diachasmimorpha longicaudata]|uniref:uncharacterized protein LOC135169623 n=1 Tax=Diachasmimorpha longicaudata TaxID=58733 RepID=UPI0030B9168B